jgi:hypothetical protein
MVIGEIFSSISVYLGVCDWQLLADCWWFRTHTAGETYVVSGEKW